MSKKIAFYHPCLDIQGTGVSNFDFAYYNQKLLGNKSFMIYDKHDHRSHSLAIKKFEDSPIETIAIEGPERMDLLEKKLEELQADAVYILKNGRKNDGRYVNNIPMLIHVNGCHKDPHGLVYAYNSKWLAKKFSNDQLPSVPYVVSLPEHDEDFREDLGIPKNATVISRMGGYYAWNIKFVNDAVIDSLKQRDDIYFLFVQTHEFANSDRYADSRERVKGKIIHMEPFADLHTKRKFINTSDAFLHAQPAGESFGHACAEYSICNKPVITYRNVPQKSHIELLGDKAFYYENYDSALDILVNFYPQPEKDWNAYRHLSPELAMQTFKEVFLDKV